MSLPNTSKKDLQQSTSSNKIFGDVYADGLCELVMYYASLENIEDKILRMQSVRSVIDGFYHVMVKKGGLQPAKELSEEKRKEIARKTEGYGLTRQERIKACRAIYLMQQIKNDD